MHLHANITNLVALRQELHAPRRRAGRGRERAILATIVRQYAPKMRAEFVKAVRAAVQQTDAGGLLDALKRGAIDDAVRAVAWTEAAEPVLRSGLMGAFVEAFERSGVLHMSLTQQRGTGKQAAFSLVDDRPLNYIRDHGAALVSEFGLQNRDALRDSLTSMLQRGMTPQEMQRAIVPQVGLTRPWAAAVDRRLEKLLADGVSMADAQAEAAKYADELVKLRALNIARTEALIAHGAADTEHRRQAVERGLADADKATKTWNTAGDDVVRDEHAEMEGVSVKWDEDFEVDYPNRTERVDGPPEGVNCRCWVEFSPLG